MLSEQVLTFGHTKLNKEVSYPFVEVWISFSLLLFFYILYVEHTLKLNQVESSWFRHPELIKHVIFPF